jgi:hypothetical protein
MRLYGNTLILGGYARPRRPSGNPPLKALAVKLPAPIIEEVRRYADLHGMSISEVIREGLDMRLHGPQQTSEYNGNTSLPITTATLLTRLATTLITAAEQLRSACASAVVPEGKESQSTAELQPYNSSTVSFVEEYNGNTLHTVPDTAPKQEPSEENQSSEACPDFDRTKNVLGKLCRRGHEWGTTGKSLLRLPNLSCRACENEHRREKRAAQRQTELQMV